MKIKINKKHLMQGVKFKYVIANKPLIDMKISFCYHCEDNAFYIINHFDDNKVYKYDNYVAFRKKITDIIEKW